MAKKNFLDNPALKFISLPQEQDTAPESAEPESKPELAEPESKPEPEQQTCLDEMRAVVPEGYRLEKITEKRTKRIQLVTEPSLYDRLKAAAAAAGVSVNEYVIQAINEKIEREN